MSGKKIVIVDDEPDIVLFLQTALEDNGYTTLTASGAVDAMTIIKREKPQLVCLDILMPEESGISLFQKIRSDPDLRGTPVIIHSGLNLSRDLDQVDFLHLEDGTAIPEPDGFIEKPIDPDRFLDMVRRMVG